ncbi:MULTISPECIES: hypothetical protein [unclassified Paenibacillus]|nr:hypothetical protein [Paenibacillus sp. Y412MC10]
MRLFEDVLEFFDEHLKGETPERSNEAYPEVRFYGHQANKT